LKEGAGPSPAHADGPALIIFGGCKMGGLGQGGTHRAGKGKHGEKGRADTGKSEG
jgi:hypothetical protein